MTEAENTGRYNHTVYASRAGRYQIARAEVVQDAWLRFRLNADDYRKLSSAPDLSAIVTVDKRSADIWGVRFLGGQSG